MRRRGFVAAVLVAALGLAGCTSSHAAPTASPRTSAPVPSSAIPSASPTPDRATALVAGMSRSERAGAVLMTAGTAAALPGLAGDVRRFHLGGVMVRGRSSAGTAAVRRAVDDVQAAAPDGLPLLIATDQEGGLVQVLSGPGFTTIPSGEAQGRLPVSALRSDAAAWGRALDAAGVDLDLAPVADVPCAADLHDNPPIAALTRDYGTDPDAAGAHVAAFVRGMHDAGVATAVKHFPGLGCVTANTDTTAHVVDGATAPDSPRLRSFQDGVDAGTAIVMVSSAEYDEIDPGTPALFSPIVIGGLLRSRAGFDGVVMSDDVGGAVALKAWSPADRATRFIGAGGDLLLDIVPADLAPMHAALVAAAEADPAFDARLTAAATRVVAARLALASRP